MTDLVCPKCNKRSYDWDNPENDDKLRPIKKMICGECIDIENKTRR